MAISPDTGASARFAIETIRQAERWRAYLIPVSNFPIDPQNGNIPHFVAALCQAAPRHRPSSLEVFFQITELHRGNGSERVGAHGREWIPMMGLGVWPDREQPRLWTMEDFKDMDPQVGPPKLMYQLLRVTTAQSERQKAIGVMAGLGTLAVILADPPDDRYLAVSSPLLSANIRERAFWGLPFYAPLFESKSVRGAAAEQLDAWMGPAWLYVRESPEDGGVLIVSREPLDPVFAEVGACATPERPGWWEA